MFSPCFSEAFSPRLAYTPLDTISGPLPFFTLKCCHRLPQCFLTLQDKAHTWTYWYAVTSVSLPPPSTPWIPLPVWNPSHGEWHYHTQHFISFYKPYFSTETDLCIYIHAGFFRWHPSAWFPPLHWIHINLRPFYLTFLPDFLTSSPESFLFHHKSPNLAEWVLKTTKFHNAIWWIEIHCLLVILLPWLKLIVG